METIETEIAVVGGGGAGMSAADAAASNGAKVLVIDENPGYGGQIWRKGAGSKAPAEALRLAGRLEQKGVRLFAGATVYDASTNGILIASSGSGPLKITFEKLIVGTGARERFIPFPGWTLPNIYGAGGLQSLVKGGLNVADKRIIVAGTGPLLLAVADFLRKNGADVLFVAEKAALSELVKLAARLALFPSKLLQAASLSLKSGIRRIRANSYVVGAYGNGKLERVRVNHGGKTSEYECDMLASGFHLVPNIELPLLLGCERHEDGIEVDEFQETSVANIYAVGETTGIGGIELSCVEGEIGGHAATGNHTAAKALFRQRAKYANFAKYLNRAYGLRDELREVLDEETLVCRCEDVTYGELKEYGAFRDAKLQTRCGMGPCQGRICGTALEYLLGWKAGTVRPPLVPVKLRDLGDYEF